MLREVRSAMCVTRERRTTRPICAWRSRSSPAPAMAGMNDATGLGRRSNLVARHRGDRAMMRNNTRLTRRRSTQRTSAPFGAAACARTSSRPASGRVRPGASGPVRRPGLAARLSTVCALGCAIAVSGCAPGSALPEAGSGPALAEAQICRPDPAFLAPQPAPDCGFERSNLKTLDPDGWARLKLEYERKCYQNAEKTVRERLRRLQAAMRCEAEAAQQ